MAEATGISIASYRRLERGKVARPPLWWYVNCAAVLNVDSLEDIVAPGHLSWHATASAPAKPDLTDLLGHPDRYARAVRWREESDW